MKIRNKHMILRFWPMPYSNIPSSNKEVIVGDIPIGTVFLGRIETTPRLLLRDYIGVVDLEDPMQTWKLGSNETIIEDFTPVDVEITIIPKEGETL